MGLFSSKPRTPSRPQSRTIPTLEPDYFDDIERRLKANGGSDSSTAIACGVGNAIYNKGLQFLDAVGDRRKAREFEDLFENRSPQDRTVPDRMVDFLVAYHPPIQAPGEGFLATLLARLDDVLSRRE